MRDLQYAVLDGRGAYGDDQRRVRVAATATARGTAVSGAEHFHDFKRHDLGPGFHERNYDPNLPQQTLFMTLPLWGVGTTAPW